MSREQQIALMLLVRGMLARILEYDADFKDEFMSEIDKGLGDIPVEGREKLAVTIRDEIGAHFASAEELAGIRRASRVARPTQ